MDRPGSPRLSKPRFWKGGLFVGSSLLVFAVFLFTHQMLSRLTAEVETTSRVFATFCAQASIPATRNPELQAVFAEIIKSIDFPIVITDSTGLPRAWRGINIDPALVSDVALDTTTP